MSKLLCKTNQYNEVVEVCNIDVPQGFNSYARIVELYVNSHDCNNTDGYWYDNDDYDEEDEDSVEQYYKIVINPKDKWVQVETINYYTLESELSEIGVELVKFDRRLQL